MIPIARKSLQGAIKLCNLFSLNIIQNELGPRREVPVIDFYDFEMLSEYIWYKNKKRKR